MMRFLFALVAAAVAGAAGGHYALMESFGLSSGELFDKLGDRGVSFGAVVALPVLFFVLRGWLGWIVASLLLSAVTAGALKFALEDDAPWDQVLTLTTVYALIAVAVYRLLVGRVLG